MQESSLYSCIYFQRLYILAKDVIELEKQYVCTFKASLKSRTSTLYVVLSLDQSSCSTSVQFHYHYSDPRCLFHCIPSNIDIKPDTTRKGESVISMNTNVITKKAERKLKSNAFCNNFLLSNICCTVITEATNVNKS